MENPFNNPEKYRAQILKSNLLNFKKKKLSGKSLACIFLTRFCSTGCPFCFYKSAPAWRKKNIEDQFDNEGVQKFIKFAKKANLGYLLISGGGEPLNQRKHILQVVEETEVDRIVLVTSANWGKNYLAAQRYVEDIYNAICRRKTPTKVVLRVSVSKGHTIKIGLQPTINLIKIFTEKYADKNNFILQIKTFDDDDTFDKILENFPNHIKSDYDSLVTDNSVLIKKIPNRYIVKINNYQFVVGVSKIFNSGLQPDLHNPENLKHFIDVFNSDLQDSEDDNPAVVTNPNQENGIDWSINYNGDICTWQNQVRDNYQNLYEDIYEDIMAAYLNDPITYSFIDKGSKYRDNIVAEVDPHAVIRTKAIGLRDTSGTIIFEEERTRLYYAIRVLQDYISEGKITKECVEKWPCDIKNLVKINKIELQKLFKLSTFTIISQQKQKPFSETAWKDLFHLIKLGHYTLSKEETNNALDFYNKHSDLPVKNIEEIEVEKDNIERRLTERLMHIKPLKRFKFNINTTNKDEDNYETSRKIKVLA